MKFTKIAAGVALAMAASVSYADFVEFGFDENEHFTDEASGANSNMTVPAVYFGLNPVDGSPLHISGGLSTFMKDASTNRAGDFDRQQLFVSYKWDIGGITYSQKAGFRRNNYAEKRDMEYRFFPEFSMQMGDTKLFLNTFFNFVTTTDRTSGDRTESDKFNYEIDLGGRYSLNDTSWVQASVFTEQNDMKDAVIGGAESYSQYQFRIVYGTQVTDKLSGDVFARIDLGRDTEYKGDLETKEEKRNRYGVNAMYKFNDDWALRGMMYYQTQDDKAHAADGSQINADDVNDKIVYTLMVRRSF